MDICYFFVGVLFVVSSVQRTVSADHYVWVRNEAEISTLQLMSLEETTSSVGQPLLLTPYIDKGEIQSARNLAGVKPQLKEWPSYSGYFTVNAGCDSNLFFWFIPAKNSWKTAPVLLWLQGGPGAGSLYGLFKEIGPFNHFPSGLESRNYTWNNDNNIIYIDQPVGTGYSFSTKKCYAESTTTVIGELYSALVQFFKLFPELINNRFFITGESFAGHYIPGLAIYIHNTNPTAAVNINLAGILIGNPLIKLSCHDYASFLFQWGTISKSLRDEIMDHQNMLNNHESNQQFREAWKDWQYILNDLIGEKTFLLSRECMVHTPYNQSDYTAWITTPIVRQQIHVGSTEYNDINLEVYDKLTDTIAQPMTSEIEQLLETGNYSVGFYSGNIDMISMPSSTECVLNGLQWCGSQKYLATKRKPFTVDGVSLAGWVKYSGPLFLVVVRDAGHSVPTYQPVVTHYLISKVTTADPTVNPGIKILDYK